MATPVGHYLLGLTIAELAARDETERRRAPWWALIACAPDLDALPGALVGNLALFHHGASHSLAAAAMVAVASTGVLTYARGAVSPWMPAVVFMLYASHSVLDSFTLDPGWPIGVPFLWPWSHETFQAPWVLLPNVQHTRAPVISVHNALLMVREVVIFAPLAGLVLTRRPSVRRRWRTATWLCAVWFLVAAGLSIASLS